MLWKDEGHACSRHKPRRWPGGFGAHIEAVAEQPAVPVHRLALLLVPPRDHVRDARGQSVRGPPEPQGAGAGVDHHDEVALDLLEANNAHSQTERPCPPAAPRRSHTPWAEL